MIDLNKHPDKRVSGAKSILAKARTNVSTAPSEKDKIMKTSGQLSQTKSAKTKKENEAIKRYESARFRSYSNRHS